MNIISPIKKKVLRLLALGALCVMSGVTINTSYGSHALTGEDDHVQRTPQSDTAQQYVETAYGYQHRLVEIKVAPEERIRLPRYCIGHWSPQFDQRYCEGCRDGEEIIKPKRIVIMRDIWVGCEALEQMVALGHAEVTCEELMISNETRGISGEPITRNAWERKRIYALTEEGVQMYRTNQYTLPINSKA